MRDVYKFDCHKCGKRFKHKKSIKRHNSSQPYCHKTNEVNPVQFDFDQFSRTLRDDLAVKSPSSVFGDTKTGKNKLVTVEERSIGSRGQECEICKIYFSSEDKYQIHLEEHLARFDHLVLILFSLITTGFNVVAVIKPWGTDKS